MNTDLIIALVTLVIFVMIMYPIYQQTSTFVITKPSILRSKLGMTTRPKLTPGSTAGFASGGNSSMTKLGGWRCHAHSHLPDVANNYAQYYQGGDWDVGILPGDRDLDNNIVSGGSFQGWNSQLVYPSQMNSKEYQDSILHSFMD